MLIENKTQEEWNTEIDAYTIADLWEPVFDSLYIDKEYNNKNRAPREPSEYYDRIDVFQMVAGEQVFATKLPFQDYLDAEVIYKQSLKDDIAVQFQDQADREAVALLISDIDLNVAIAELGLNEPNAALYAALLIQEKDLAQAQALVDAYNSWRDSQDILDAEDIAIKDGVALIEKGKKIVAYINYLNRQKSLTPTQFQQIMDDVELEVIERLCLNGSIASAKFQIEAYVPDGTVMLQDDKDKILAFINRV